MFNTVDVIHETLPADFPPVTDEHMARVDLLAPKDSVMVKEPEAEPSVPPSPVGTAVPPAPVDTAALVLPAADGIVDPEFDDQYYENLVRTGQDYDTLAFRAYLRRTRTWAQYVSNGHPVGMIIGEEERL